ncbi:MAG: NYN domain-containing protein [Verrucomicrobiota bacterium]|nr:NYN domain-containing protein [Verrucomicrobiota bacterium]
MRYLIVDGHSVIFAWPELRKLHGQRTGKARDALVKSLTEYQDSSGVRVVAVFDGKGEKASEETEPGGIQVFYSATGQTADDLVERLVAKYAQEHEITVATADMLEQQTVSSFGGVPISVETLRAHLEEAKADLVRHLKALKRRL